MNSLLLVPNVGGGLIINIYISHSVGCVGWDMERIYQNTLFQTGCRTMRFKDADIGKVKMLDWDFLEWEKKPAKVEARHLELARDYEFEVVMSMDLWKHNIHEALSYADELQKHTDQVLIPIHYYVPELLQYDLAYPNANWFAGNVFPPADYRDRITHILGGSPQSQIAHLTTSQIDLFGHSLKFKKVTSIDGNQIFNVAIRAGKEWYPEKPYWRKAEVEIPNELIFRNSVKKFNEVIINL